MNGVTDMISGSSAKAARRSQRAAELRAEQQQKQQEAIQLRATLAADKEAEKVGTETASLTRTAAARRSGKNGLAFATTGLKTTLGA